jgi:hypothetical protein
LKRHWVSFALLSALLALGCEPPRRAQRSTSSSGTEEAQQELLARVADNLRVHDELAEGDILHTIIDDLNRWLQTQPTMKRQTSPKLLESLPPALREIGPAKRITAADFTDIDAVFLQEATWLKASAEIAGQVSSEELQAAENVFDWVIRNIQLEAPSKNRVPHYVSEVMFFGKGTAEERGWLFASLCRQIRLPVVMLAIQKPDGPAVPWACAALVNQKLYLFDPWLGLPLRTSDGKSIATLADVQQNPTLLRKLDWNAEHPYPVTAEDLSQLVIWVEAAPGYLAGRLKLVEAGLTGSDRLRLSVDLEGLTEHLQAAAPDVKVALWPMPYQVLKEKTHPDDATKIAAALQLAPFRFKLPARPQKASGNENERSFADLDQSLAGGDTSKSNSKETQSGDLITPLRLGRVRQLRGEFRPPRGAIPQYQWAVEPKWVAQVDGAVKEATEHPDTISPENAENLKKLQPIVHWMNNAATYWLGLVMMDRKDKDYDSSIYYFDLTLSDRSLKDWHYGAKYNKARALEAEGKFTEAAKLLSADTTSPQCHGNQIRARQLSKPE